MRGKKREKVRVKRGGESERDKWREKVKGRERERERDKWRKGEKEREIEREK